jgi:hypothetical protein
MCAALLALTGCVERTLTITSTPEGADVWVDGKNVGATPVDVPFSWYGTREIVVEKDGYETRNTKETIDPPWWQYPVLDLMTDVLIPATFTDQRTLDYTLDKSPDTTEAAPIEQNAAPLRKLLNP